MAIYTTLLSLTDRIRSVIFPNTVKAIKASKHQPLLIDIVESLWSTSAGVEVVDTTDYTISRLIRGNKIIVALKVKPTVTGVAINWVAELIPAGIAKHFKFQEYLQTADNDGVYTTENSTILFNKLVDDGSSETFSFFGRGFGGGIGRYARLDDHDYSTPTPGSQAGSLNYQPALTLPQIDATPITATYATPDGELAEYTVVIEGILVY